MATYKVKVPNFEGPLDLLLFFIKRDELDIYDIPIAHITKEFLDYAQLMQMLDLDLAGEFIVMAAMLMQIKVRLMLPKTVIESEDGDGEDPRAELVRRLLEYRRYKEITSDLRKMEEAQRHVFFRKHFSADIHLKEEDENVLKDATMFDLIKAFQKAITAFTARPVHEIEQVPYTIEDQARYIIDRFNDRKEYNFVELMAEMREKIQVVVTFIALLELIRAHRVSIIVQAEYNDIRIIKTVDESVHA